MPDRTTPDSPATYPKGIPFIVGNEAAERFSYYGMRAILVIFMTRYLLDANGDLAVMSNEEAMTAYHLFATANYAMPLIGAILSDWLLGKYRTIMLFSLIYCLGHLAMAADETRLGLTVGLTLIALGSGGIKPCVSAHVGDQFTEKNSSLLSKVYSWFYFSINAGSLVSSLLCPILLEYYGPQVAFGLPTALMLVATWVFWLGRNTYIHVPAAGSAFFTDLMAKDNLSVFMRLGVLYLFVAMFWALFDQTGSAWVLQAASMDRHLFGIEILPSQLQALNPVLVLMFTPMCVYALYPALNRLFQVTPLRKMGMGFILTTLSFATTAYAQHALDQGEVVSIAWQVLAYALITLGEVMISITCLEYSYTQAPQRLKSVVSAFFLLSVAFGNLFVSAINYFLQNESGKAILSGASYYWFFASIMLLSTVLFACFIPRMHGQQTTATT